MVARRRGHRLDRITDRTKAIVVINPNNPTGAVYPEHVLRDIVEVARTHGLMILADEIYDKILYDDAVHTSIASLAPDLLSITFNGLSKAYRVAGFRAGWMALYGPEGRCDQLHRGPGRALEHAPVPERPGPARRRDGARRAPVDQSAAASRRAAARAARTSPTRV